MEAKRGVMHGGERGSAKHEAVGLCDVRGISDIILNLYVMYDY